MIERLAMIPAFLFHILGLTISMIIFSILAFTWVPIVWIVTGEGILWLNWLFNWIGFHSKGLINQT